MGRASRAKRTAGTDRARTGRKVDVSLAGNLVTGAYAFATRPVPPGPHADLEQNARSVARCVLDQWEASPVALRADTDFLRALADSDTDVELEHSWTTQLPFDAIAVALTEPLVLHDGTRECTYSGFLACGVTSRPRRAGDPAPPQRGRPGKAPAWTTYGPLAEGDGVRFLWLFTTPDSFGVQAQTVTVMLKGQFSPFRTLADLVAVQQRQGQEMGSWGQEMPVLVPLSVQTLMYLCAREPDLTEVPVASRTHYQRLDGAAVHDLGWRVGAALRTYRSESTGRGQATPAAGAAASSGQSSTEVSRAMGWRLPPHIRRAHWHRVRVAVRDESGAIVGDRGGVQGQDWTYQLRWYPPTPVNAQDGAVAASLRTLEQAT